MNPDLPLVSVAIISYNQKPFLEEAVASVLAQDYPNIEIVIADDCSSDGSQDLARELAKKHPGKFVLRLATKNAGVTANSNAAHFACTGKYIAWLGGDDLMFPDKISKQVVFMESHPECNIVYHNLEVFDSATGKTIKLFNSAKDSHEGDVRTAIKYGTFNGGCATMVRRDKTPAIGFDPDLDVASDWLHWIETLRYGGRICFINEVLGRYRRHRNNVTSTNSKFFQRAIKDHLDTLKKVSAYPEDYSKEIAFAYSNIYRSARSIAYRKNLLLSVKYDKFNARSWAGLLLNLISFNKLKP